MLLRVADSSLAALGIAEFNQAIRVVPGHMPLALHKGDQHPKFIGEKIPKNDVPVWIWNIYGAMSMLVIPIADYLHQSS